jgi:hypothetical protein
LAVVAAGAEAGAASAAKTEKETTANTAAINVDNNFM